MLPFFALQRKLQRQRRSIETAASEIEVLQPEEAEEIPSPYYLEGQPEKAIAGVAGFSTVEQEVGLVRQRIVPHPAVIRYTLRNCLVHDAGVSTVSFGLSKKKLSDFHFLRDPIEEHDSATYCMTSVSHQFFGHWMQDACPTALLASPDEATILDARADWPHTTQYINAFGFSPVRSRLQFVRSLHVFQDHGQGSSKRQRYGILRRRLEDSFGEGLPAQAVYLRRGATGQQRVMANSAEIEDALAARGFEIFDHEPASTAEIYRRFRNATLVVSMEGSHLNHLYYAMRPGTAIVALIPNDRFSFTEFGYAAATGLKFGFMVAQRTQDGYHVDLRDLLATIDLVA